MFLVLSFGQNADTAINRASFDIADGLRVRRDQYFDVDVACYGLGRLSSPGEYDFCPMRLDLCGRFAGICGIEFITCRRSFCLVDGDGLCPIRKPAHLAEKD